MAYEANFQRIEPTQVEVAALPGWTLLEFGQQWCGICTDTQEKIYPRCIELWVRLIR